MCKTVESFVFPPPPKKKCTLFETSTLHKPFHDQYEKCPKLRIINESTCLTKQNRSPLNLYSLFEEKMKPEFWQSWQSCTCIWNILVSHYPHINQHLWDQVSKKIKSYRKIVAENYPKWKLKVSDTLCSVMTIKISNLGNQYIGRHKRSIHNSGIHKRSSITKALYNKTLFYWQNWNILILNYFEL